MKYLLLSLTIFSVIISGCNSGDSECCSNQNNDNNISPSGFIAPKAVITNLNSTKFTVGEEITFDGTTSSDQDGKIVNYEWQIGSSTYNGEKQTVLFDTNGKKTIKLTVTDNDNLTNSTQITIDIDPKITIAPVAMISNLNNKTFLEGEKITLDGTASSDQDGEIINYEWQIGSSTYNGATQTVSFDTNGTKTIMLTVTDNDNLTNSIEASIHIQSPLTTPVAVITTEEGVLPEVGKPFIFSCSDSYDQDENGESIVKCDWNITSYDINGDFFRECPITLNSITGEATVVPCNDQVAYAVIKLTVTDDENETNTTSATYNFQGLVSP
jgi:chitodextrinase